MRLPIESVRKIGEKRKYGLLMKFALDRMAMLGVEAKPFYLVEERLWEDLAPDFERGFEAFATRLLGPEEMEDIAGIPGYGFSKGELVERLERGCLCFGVRDQETLAAFTWADPSECVEPWCRFPLKENEAYLFDAYTRKEYRGRGLAAFMRYDCYRALNRLGKDTYYSISEAFNAPSLRFKARLRARLLSLWLTVGLFGRYRWVWKLKELGASPEADP